MELTQSNREFGLTAREVEERRSRQEDNCEVKSSTKSVSDIIKGNIFTYFNLVFAVLAVLLILVGAWNDMLFLVVIFANTGIGIFQEIHSKRVLDRLTLSHGAKYVAIRDGKEVTVASEELVKDDIVLLSAGSPVPADAIVVKGTAKVNEALLTGEADEIDKMQNDTLLSGSFLISGQLLVRLERVGKESYLSKLKLQATQTKKGEQSEMIRSLNYLIIVMGIIIVPIGITLFVQSFFFNGGTLHDSVTGMVAAVIGMIPEGLYLLTSVAMAVSVIRLAKRQVLVHDMKCIETLARVDVLCVDKTGTITESGMQVKDLIVMEQERTGEVQGLLALFVRAQAKDNETMAALQEYCKEYPMDAKSRVEKVIPFSSKTKYSGICVEGRSFLLGAMESIGMDTNPEYNQMVEECSAKGYRVLVFAEYEGKLEEGAITQPVKLLALLLLTNPMRNGAKDIFSFFEENHVEIKVISGDHPLTVSAVAQDAGISGAKKYVDASTLSGQEDMNRAVLEYTVFGRVTPEQKKEIIQALKAQKKTVAMVGDGVNDVLALKSADCSVAMAAGSDAAANVSQLVLMDSDFSRMPPVVAEGRRVVNNIQRTASLYIVKNIFSMLLAVFSMIFMLDYPLEPSQITLISFFTIGMPSFILALEQNKEKMKGHFLTNVLMRSLPAGITDFLVISGLVIFSTEFAVEPHCLSTACTILLAIVGFMILYQVCKPIHTSHGILLIGLVTGLLLSIFLVGDWFSIGTLSTKCELLVLVFALLTEPIFRYLNLLVRFCERKIQQFSKNET